ncbi:MAG: sensor histidine kinase [Owenweeksia sp.]
MTKRWQYLIGLREDFGLEHRAFNAVSILTLLILLMIGVANLIMKYYDLTLLCVSIITIQAVLYFLSRFRKKFVMASAVYIIISYPVLGLFYFMNAGKAGPTMYGFFLTFLLIIIITYPKWHRLLIVTHILMGIGLLWSEYLFPEWVPYIYSNRTENFIDLSITFAISLVFIYFATAYLRKSYVEEKQLAESRARAIEENHRVMMTQKDKLRELNQEKDRLFSIIAHDLRSPLASIQSYLESIGSEGIDENERKFLESELLKLTRNTSSMLNNLLHWSSSQIKGNTILTAVNIRTLTEECLSLQSPIAEQKDITIHNNVDHGCNALADADMLELVIRNLINNAIKFTPVGGHIYISSRTEEDVIISIRDTGVGIPELKKKDIFTASVKSASGTSHETGIGLGLKLCYDFLKKMNGRIEFSSQEDIGTTFTIILKRSVPGIHTV